MPTDMDNLTYETLGRLFAHLADGVTPDVERMRAIKADYEARKLVINASNPFLSQS